jgi:hypothetical protein
MQENDLDICKFLAHYSSYRAVWIKRKSEIPKCISSIMCQELPAEAGESQPHHFLSFNPIGKLAADGGAVVNFDVTRKFKLH